MRKQDPRFDLSLYSVAETARLVRVPNRTLWNWVRGYSYPSGGKLVRAKPVIHPTALSPTVSLSFINLVESAALAGFRAAGVPMQRVRQALKFAIKRMTIDHPLASRQILTDGADLLWEFEHKYPSDEPSLVLLNREGQLVFPALVRQYLSQIEWNPSDRFAARWWLKPNRAKARVVIIDPRRAFGSPVIAGTGIRTSDIFERFSAGEPIAELAEDYGLEFEKIEEAVRTEAWLLEPVAA